MKKWLLVLGIAASIFGVTACGGSKEESAKLITEEIAYQQGDYIVESINTIAAQTDLSLLEEGSLDALAVESWLKGMEDMGSYVGITDHSAEITADKAVINITVDGTEHDAVVEIIVEKKNGSIEVTSITTNVKYSLGELMVKAALNTVLGMGTTFVILILIAFIISCFTLIPKIQAAFGGKSAKEDIKAEAVDKTIAQIIEKEEMSDDSELVAVIAAAIAASEGSSSTDGYTVRSIRRANTSKWKQA